MGSSKSYNRFGFTGYEEDRETGLYYAKARYYDPDDPVFLSEDAWEGDPNIAPSLHKYLYVYQNPTVFTDPTGNMPVNPSSARREDESGNVSYSDRNVLLNQLDSQQETVRAEQAKANVHAAAEEAKREEKQAKAAEHINEQRETAERNQATVNGELAEFNRETRRLNNQFSGGKQTSVREFQQTFGRQSTKKEIVEDGLASTAIPAEIAEYDQSIRGYSRNLNQSGLNAANVGFETLRAFDPTDPFNLAASATGPIGIAAVGTVKVVRRSKKAQNALDGGENLADNVGDASQVAVAAKGANDIHRIGGGSADNLALKAAETKLSPPGISVLQGGTPAQAAAQMRAAFPNATGLHKAAECVGSTCAAKIRAAGFDLIADPTKKFPNHFRLIHPDGAAGFTPQNLEKLSKAFKNTSGN